MLKKKEGKRVIHRVYHIFGDDIILYNHICIQQLENWKNMVTG